MAKATRKPTPKRGRPPLPPEEGKRYPLNMRTTKEVREKLEAAASESGRSLAQEVEFRVQQSLRDDEVRAEAFGGAHNYALMRLISAAIAAVETSRGAKWTEDPHVFREAQAISVRVFEMYAHVVGKGLLKPSHPRQEGLFRLDLLAAAIVSSEIKPGQKPEEILEQVKSLMDEIITDRGRAALDGC
jgi:hypothetical protein